MDYFSVKEYKTMKWFQSVRDKYIGWVVPYLKLLKITPNEITYVGMLSLIGFILLFNTHKIIALSCLLLNILLDGVDGVYARLTNQVSEFGSMLDVTSDTLSMVVSSIILIMYGIVNSIVGTYYILIYVTSLVLIIFRNKLSDRPRYAFRPKYIVFGLIIIYVINGLNIFNEIMFSFDILLTLFVFKDVVAIIIKIIRGVN